MRTVSIFLTLILTLGWAQRASALTEIETKHDYTLRIGQLKIGFSEGHAYGMGGREWDWSYIHVGPLGKRAVPFNATQGLVGTCLMVVAFVAFLALATVRWKRKQPGRL